MQRIRLPIVGAGTPDDPRRVNLPTYQMVDGSELPDGTVEVDFPDEDAPTDDPAWGDLTSSTRRPSGSTRQLTLAMLDRWHALLDSRYAEHAGKFRPESPQRPGR